MLRAAALATCLALAAPGIAQMPSTPTSVAPPAPDYALATSWALRPGPARAGVDVFYVHPTTDKSMTRWNQDVADATVNHWTDESAVARQASAFAECCRVFAPRYRQSAAGAFRDPVIRKAAFALAYGDVLRAFEAYLAHDNHGRPFILVGHSQGAVHIARLLEERIDSTPLADKLVAAYIVGIGVSEGDFGRTYKTTKICDMPAQTGCVVAWNSVQETMPDAPGFAHLLETAYTDRYGNAPGKALLCINPLTFDRSKSWALATASKGAAPGAPGFGPMKPLVPQAVSARCDGGMLRVVEAKPLDIEPLGNGSLHYHDMGLFYADIRSNALVRVRAFLKRGRR